MKHSGRLSAKGSFETYFSTCWLSAQQYLCSSAVFFLVQSMEGHTCNAEPNGQEQQLKGTKFINHKQSKA
jgi:hypothetical protein